MCGGAHGTTGTAVCDDGVMIDLSLLNAVTVDSAARRARVGGGALLARSGYVRSFPNGPGCCHLADWLATAR